jgi:putative thioredoxin
MGKASETQAWIVEADDTNFQQTAVERSRQMLVVIDFWATWCQPCRLLGPVLEKLAAEYAGRFLLVKADTDKTPNIAAGFGVQSIPAVYAMRDAQVIDFFVGLMPEDQIRSWIDRLLPSLAEEMVAEAKRVAEADPKSAEAKYLEASRLEPNLPAAKIGLAELLMQQGRLDESAAIIDELAKRGYLEPAAEKLQAQLHLSSPAQGAVDLSALREAAAASPNDPAAQLALAEGLATQRNYEEALAAALAVVQSGKKELVEPARKLMVDIFRLLPDDSQLVNEYRRKLSTALY